MTTKQTEPIGTDWTIDQAVHADVPPQHKTATEINQRLAHISVSEIDANLVPFLAAAAAEMALAAGISWRFSTDDPPVALLRLIAKAGIRDRHAGGPHTDRLFAELLKVEV